MIYLAYKHKKNVSNKWGYIELSDDLNKGRYIKHKQKKEWFETNFTYEGIMAGRWSGTSFDFKIMTKKEIFMELL